MTVARWRIRFRRLLGPDSVQRYTDEDRSAHLRRFGRSCAALADLFEQHAEPSTARTYRTLAETAGRLQAPFDHQELKELAAGLPAFPGGRHPRYLHDYGAPLPWEQEVATQYSEAARAALDLRSYATYDGPPRSDARS